MTIWLLITAVTVIACATLYYAAAGRRVNATGNADPLTAHFRLQLKEIEADTLAGRLGAAEASAARSELAREVMRSKTESATATGHLTIHAAVPLAAIAIIALGGYWMLGRPDLPGAPLAGRDLVAESASSLDGAIETIEARLKAEPDDIRGWMVIAPAYMQLGRYDDAVDAYRRVNALGTPTADSETNLGEALVMQSGGNVTADALTAFRSAAARDKTHIRSRYYLAGAETANGDYADAVSQWNELLALAKGDEPWVVTARDGLAAAQAGLEGKPLAASSAQPDQAQIDGMVSGLEQRLRNVGGTIEEWTRLVRSRLVQGRIDDAQAAYDAARAAYPDASVRTELDVLAADNGLIAGHAP
ncbi:MAG: c-type cytochrome biogenesis protein CcmI [Devosia sp.]